MKKTGSLLEGRTVTLTFQKRPKKPRPKAKKKAKKKPKPSIYYYRVGYGSYEDSGDVMLSHKDKFTPTQFRRLCIKVAPDAARKYISGKRTQKCFGGCCMYGERTLSDMTFSELYPFIAEQLTEQYGFTLVKQQAGYFLFGWPNIMDPESWKGQRDGDLDVIRKAIEKGLKWTKN